ncbi:MAG: EAL domain-containing protein, partial [Fusobacterium sp.]|nr:EAL domain-containing protein [Fusobacterium sp.]
VSLGVLKIDRLFFENLENNKRGDIIIRNVINMAQELNMKIVAEGVETFEQLEFLKSVNCDMVQGYIYDRPMPVEEFEAKYYNIK